MSALETAASSKTSNSSAELQQFQELHQQIELQRLQQSQMFFQQQRLQEIQVKQLTTTVFLAVGLL